MKALPVPFRSVIQADFVGMGMGFGLLVRRKREEVERERVECLLG